MTRLALEDGAAQISVRYSVDKPEEYASQPRLDLQRAGSRSMAPAEASAGGFDRLGLSCRHRDAVREADHAAHPMTLYDAIKSATEPMRHSDARMFGEPTTFFRFFTVYRSGGRRDMAPFNLASLRRKGQPIKVCGQREVSCDFSNVDGLAGELLCLVDAAPGIPPPIKGDTRSPIAPFRAFNFGGGKHGHLMGYIAQLERALSQTATKDMQDGDLPTAASDPLGRFIGHESESEISVGVPAFDGWFRQRHNP